MPLHPQAQAFVDTLNALERTPISALTPELARQGLQGLLPPLDVPIGAVQDFEVPGGDGQPVRARAYTPCDAHAGPLPLVLFLHGGGWVTGDLDTHDATCRELANASGCKVVALDYRLAPEHKFPAGLLDCHAALRWLVDNAKELQIDAARIVVSGDSAGGNLAAVVAISARDGDGPAIAGQLLIYPATDFAMTHPSHREPETSILLTHTVIRWFRDHYLNGAADIGDWRASPARAKTLIGLPPAYVLTAGADPLRDEGCDYAQRLRHAGVAVITRHFPGQFHGFFTMGKLLQQANVAATEIGDWLKALN